MDAVATLSIFAQLAVTLTGFAGLLTAFDVDRDGWTKAEIAALRNLFLNAVGALAFSVAPIPFLIGGADEAMVWSAFLLALAFYLAALFVGAVDYVVRLKGQPRNRAIYWGFTAGEAPLAGLLVAAAFDIGSFRGPAPYSAGLLWLLAMGTAQFIFQIFWSLKPAADK